MKKILIFYIFLVKISYADVVSSEYLYSLAISSFYDHKYYSSQLLLKDFLYFHSHNSLADRAQLYLGLNAFASTDYESAVFELQIFLHNYPTSSLKVEALYWLAESHYFLKQYEKARNIHHQILENHKTNPRAVYSMFTIGYTYLIENKYYHALTTFRDAIRHYKTSPIHDIYLLHIAKLYYKLQDDKSLIQLYDTHFADDQKLLQIPRSHNTKHQVNMIVIRSYIDKNALEYSHKALLMLLQDNPNTLARVEAFYYLSRIYFLQKNYTKALDNLEKIVRVYPKWEKIAYVYFQMAKLKYKMKDLADIEVFLQKTLDSGKDLLIYPSTLSLMGKIYVQQAKWSKALRIYEEYISLLEVSDASYYEVLYQKANVLFAQEKYKQAVKLYTQLLKSKNFTEEQMFEIRFMIAQSFFKLHLYGKTSKILNVIIRESPTEIWQVEAYFLQAYMAFSLKNFSEALTDYNKIISIYPMSSRAKHAHFKIAQIYFALSQYARSYDEWQNILNNKGVYHLNEQDLLWAKIALASCHYNLRQFDVAIKLYTNILQNYSRYSSETQEALFYLAWIYFRKEDYSTSLQYLNDYTKQYPEGHYILKVQYFTSFILYQMKKYQNAFVLVDNILQNIHLPRQLKDNSLYIKVFQLRFKLLYATARCEEIFSQMSSLPKGIQNSNYIEEFYYTAVNCALKQDAIMKAENYTKMLQELSPGSLYLKDTLLNLAEHYKIKQQYTKAHEMYNQINTIYYELSEQWSAKIAKIHLYIEEQQYDQAVKWMNDLLGEKQEEVLPFQLDILNTLCDLYLRQKKYDLILQVLGKYQGILQGNEELNGIIQGRIWQIQVYIIQGKLELASKLIMPLMNEKNFASAVHFYAGMIAYKQKDYKKAHEYWYHLSKFTHDSYSASALYYIGQLYFSSKKYKNAIVTWEKFIFRYPGYEELYEKAMAYLVQCYAIMKDKKKYIKYYKQFLEEFPQSLLLRRLEESRGGRDKSF